jgi:hypothetical protein
MSVLWESFTSFHFFFPPFFFLFLHSTACFPATLAPQWCWLERRGRYEEEGLVGCDRGGEGLKVVCKVVRRHLVIEVFFPPCLLGALILSWNGSIVTARPS